MAPMNGILDKTPIGDHAAKNCAVQNVHFSLVPNSFPSSHINEESIYSNKTTYIGVKSITPGASCPMNLLIILNIEAVINPAMKI